jgi:uncharacterized protein (TIGR02594 family)
MNEPRWLPYARRFIGLKEIPGTENNPVIIDWLIKLKAWWREDETPWCGTFVAAVCINSGIPLPVHWYRARGWLDWGSPLDFPVLGCVVVYERKGGGHVGFVMGEDQNGNLMTLGGNQSNKVSIAPFDRSRVLGYRWPAGERVLSVYPLPLIESGAKVSFNEA